jgi:hypothetical protein
VREIWDGIMTEALARIVARVVFVWLLEHPVWLGLFVLLVIGAWRYWFGREVVFTYNRRYRRRGMPRKATAPPASRAAGEETG